MTTAKNASLGPKQLGTVISHYSVDVAVEDQHGEIFRCFFRQGLGQLVVGDKVLWRLDSGNRGVVISVLKRKTLLSRLGKDGQEKPVAANIDCVAVVVSVSNAIEALAIDRYLVAAELSGLTPILIMNKIDLLQDVHRSAYEKAVVLYRGLGYSVLETSLLTGEGLLSLKAIFRGHCGIVVGESGVGKSSILSFLLPHENIRIGEVSEITKHGQHTTTASYLYHLPEGGDLIDSPGIRSFNLWHTSQTEIAQGFIEFAPYLGRCKFRNCEHRQEPACALQEAVKTGAISAERFKHYQQIVADFG